MTDFNDVMRAQARVLSERIAQSALEIEKSLGEFRRAGLSYEEIAVSVWDCMPTDTTAAFGSRDEFIRMVHRFMPVGIGASPDDAEDTEVTQVDDLQLKIRKELSLAVPLREGDEPAIEAAVMLAGIALTMSGSLSAAPGDHLLRMLSPGGNDAHGRPVMIEQFFDIRDVVCFAMQRVVTAQSSRLVQV